MKTSYMGKLARINLTTGQITVESVDRRPRTWNGDAL